MTTLLICVLIFGAGCFALGYAIAAAQWCDVRPPRTDDDAWMWEIEPWVDFDADDLPSRVIDFDSARDGLHPRLTTQRTRD